MTARRYGVWSGSAGRLQDPTRCVVAVGGNTAWGPANERQCSKTRGFGPGGDYCKVHAPAAPPRVEVAERGGNVVALETDGAGKERGLAIFHGPDARAHAALFVHALNGARS